VRERHDRAAKGARLPVGFRVVGDPTQTAAVPRGQAHRKAFEHEQPANVRKRLAGPACARSVHEREAGDEERRCERIADGLAAARAGDRCLPGEAEQAQRDGKDASVVQRTEVGLEQHEREQCHEERGRAARDWVDLAQVAVAVSDAEKDAIGGVQRRGKR